MAHHVREGIFILVIMFMDDFGCKDSVRYAVYYIHLVVLP